MLEKSTLLLFSHIVGEHSDFSTCEIVAAFHLKELLSVTSDQFKSKLFLETKALILQVLTFEMVWEPKWSSYF